jgi:hypothetical protein
MALGDVEMIETGRGIIEQAATRLGKVALVAGDKGLPPVCPCSDYVISDSRLVSLSIS